MKNLILQRLLVYWQLCHSLVVGEAEAVLPASTGGSTGSSIDCSTSSSLVSSSNVFPTSLAVSSLTSGCETSSSFVSALKSKLDVGANLVIHLTPTGVIKRR